MDYKKADILVESLIARRDVSVSEDFDAKLFSELERCDAADALADSLLAAEVASASPSFTDSVMAKARSARRAELLKSFSPVFAAAACAAFAFLAFAPGARNVSGARAIAGEIAQIDSEISALEAYDSTFDAYVPGFCDYDLNLYATL